MKNNNPFVVTSPESLTPKDIASLYVNVITDIGLITAPSHTFIHGFRGTGKSMLLRYMEPEVQLNTGVKCIRDLKFFAVHIPLKSNYFISELQRLDGDDYNYFAEHVLVSLLLTQCFAAMMRIAPKGAKLDSSFISFLDKKLNLLGHAGGLPEQSGNISDISQIFSDSFSAALNYLKRYSNRNPGQAYNGPLFGYTDLLIPLLERCKQLPFMPQQFSFYLMLDDADNAPIKVQKIINTWVSYRSNEHVSLKVTTQQRYKTYRTIYGKYIEKPHDFHDIDLTTIYSPATSDFNKRIEEILSKRFELYGIKADPKSFFPLDKEQEEEITQISKNLREAHKLGKGRGHRASDDAIRYARPDFMASLAGQRKASSTYSYAGFDNLVNLSNGVIRWFLEPASRMYSQQQLENKNKNNKSINEISVSIQDKVVSSWSEEFIHDLDTKTREKEDDESLSKATRVAKQALKLIDGLGKVSRRILLSPDRAERRVFTYMLSGDPGEELRKVLDACIEWGYLQMKYIGDKEGLGRKPQYILSRRLAPFFKIDTTGFAGNLSVTVEQLEIACTNPDEFVRIKMNDKEDDLPLFSGLMEDEDV